MTLPFRHRAGAIDVDTTFHQAATRHGCPASVLSDNGAIFTSEANRGHLGVHDQMTWLSSCRSVVVVVGEGGLAHRSLVR